MNKPIAILLLYLFFNLTTWVQASSATAINPTGNLTFDQIVQLVKSQNLEVSTSKKELQAKQILIQQASVLPNPEIELESENIFGSADNTSFDNAETTARLGTTLELGGKRRFRIQAAKIERQIAHLSYLSVLSTQIKEAKQYSTEVLKQQQLLKLFQERLKTSQAFQQEITKRVEKGRLNVVEQKRASILVAQSKLALTKRNQELVNAKNKLSLIWGYSEAQFKNVEGDLQLIDELPSLEKLQEKSEVSIGVLIKKTEVDLAEVEIDIEKSQGSQDLSVAGGIKHENSSNDKSFVISAGMPIAIFNRNTGAIEAAKLRLNQKELELQSVDQDIQNLLMTLSSQAKILKTEIESLSQTVIPESQHVFERIQEGYLKGKYSYIAVLEAQNANFEFREHYLGALADYHNVVAEITQLTEQLQKGEEDVSTNN